MARGKRVVGVHKSGCVEALEGGTFVEGTRDSTSGYTVVCVGKAL